MKKVPINIVLIGVCYFRGMASTNRVRNLLTPLLKDNSIKLSNLIAHKGEFLDELPNSGVSDGVKYVYCGKRLMNPIFFLYELIRGTAFLIGLKDRRKLNFIYCYESPGITNVLFLFIAKIFGYKILFDITEDYGTLNTENLSFKGKSRIYFINLLIRLVPRLGNVCIGITPHIVENLQLICKKHTPVYHLPITVDVNMFSLNTSKKKNSNFKTIFYGGSFTERDGIFDLIDVFDKIANFNNSVVLKITGDTNDGSTKNKLLQKISQCKNQSRIVMTGYLNFDDYIQNLSEAYLCCVPRTQSSYSNSSFPYKLGEFLASGIPVIVSRVSYVDTYLRNGIDAIIITPGSKGELEEGILFLFSDIENAKTIGGNGRNVAKKYFDSQLHAHKLVNILNESIR